MSKDKVIDLRDRVQNEGKSELDKIIRQGAQKMLQAAIEDEVSEYLLLHQNVRDQEGHQAVVRNGYHKSREIISGVGPLEVKAPRVRHRDGEEKFSSKILPPFMRKVPSIDALIPALYLKGISTGDFSQALEAILGKDAPGLSASNIVRLKECWEKEYESWSRRSLEGKNYVYWWVDGVHFNIRLEQDRSCILVIMGATTDGTKELIAVEDGYRESKQSWLEILRDLKNRGLKSSPKLVTGDGALGFWAAFGEEYPKSKQQRCWVHKTANILDKMPKSVQAKAKTKIHDIYLAPTKKEAQKAYNHFVDCFEAKYPKAVECLTKDNEVLLNFYDYPAQHWLHIRSTNPIESTFATVRHRQRKTKGCGSRKATLSMVFKLVEAAEKRWRKLNGHQLIDKIIQGVVFVDGEELPQEMKAA